MKFYKIDPILNLNELQRPEKFLLTKFHHMKLSITLQNSKKKM